MPSWKNVNFIKLKWNFLITSILEMVYAWILIRFKTIMNRATPISIHDVQCFIWFANFY
jgi:hypothetical protein